MPRSKKWARISLNFLLTTYIGITFAAPDAPSPVKITTPSSAKHIILFIWDGLRPDSITEQNTPNLFKLKQQGVWFSDNHSSYPTLTMMNAASFATGNLAGKTGFFGNTLWDPKAKGMDSKGEPVNYNNPVFTEDYKILSNLDQPNIHDPLLYVATLFAVAQKSGIKTAALGKSGPAFMQDYQAHGLVLDEKHISPLDFAKKLQSQEYPLPKYTPFAYTHGKLALSSENGDPTAFGELQTLKVISGGSLGVSDDFMYPENVTSDPTLTTQTQFSQSNEYIMDTFLTKILPEQNPTLSVVWLRHPDSTEHNYGVGSPSYYTALQDQDQLLGRLIERLHELKLAENTDLIVASDHGHSNVSGPLEQFPLRMIHNGMVSVPDIKGYSVSGEFRPADLLTRAGFHAYDGLGCSYNPVLTGIKEDGTQVYPINIDKTGMACQTDPKNNRLYTTPSYQAPAKLPADAVIVANNGGSTYLYVVNHDPKLVAKLTRYFQGRQEFGAVFVDNRYTHINGTLPLSLIHVQNAQGRNPDIIACSNYDENALISEMRGIEFNAGGLNPNRGTHGNFSPIDVHNTLIASGPDFKAHFIDPLPSGNIDVAPTIAYLLHLDLTNTDGRPLLEALKNGPTPDSYSVVKMNMEPSAPATGLNYQLATNPDGKDRDPTKTNYTIELKAKVLLQNGNTYQYFDSAKAKRY